MARNISRRRSLGLLGGVTGVVAGRATFLRAQSQPVITFGGTIPFSGRWAEVGQSVNAGYQTVAKYVNDVNGGLDVGGKKYRLNIQLVDDASDPQRATTLLQKQIDDGTQYFLGSYSSGIVLPQAAIINRARRPMVQAGGGADAIFMQGYRYIFGMYPRPRGPRFRPSTHWRRYPRNRKRSRWLSPTIPFPSRRAKALSPGSRTCSST